MIKLKAIHSEYLYADKTIETILVLKKSCVDLFVFNYLCCSFRIFENVLDLISFFEDKFEPKISFDDENELDEYLEKVDIISG